MQYGIKELNKDEKPREKLISKGASALTDEELLAIIINTGGINTNALDIARELLRHYEKPQNLLNTDIEKLKSYKHIGVAKACKIKAAVELGLRMMQTKSEETIKLSNPKDLYNLMKSRLYNKKKEYLYVICINSRNRVIAVSEVSIGTTTETIVNPKDIFSIAIEKNAVGIVLAHNHPSNDPSPSAEDIAVTKRIASVGEALGIQLVDHIIVCNQEYVSMKALNLISRREELNQPEYSSNVNVLPPKRKQPKANANGALLKGGDN